MTPASNNSQQSADDHEPSNIGFLLVFVPIALPLGCWYIGDYFDNIWLSTWLIPFLLLGVIPILDHLIGQSTHSPPDNYDNRFRSHPWLRLLPICTFPAWQSLFWWAGSQLDALTVGQTMGWIISLSFIAALSLINVGHELIHRNTSIERIVGGLLLASVWNVTFKVEHIRGHHRQVATPYDHSTAKRGQTVYTFIAQALPNNIKRGWLLEQQRLHAQQLGRWHNEIVQFGLFALALTALVGIIFEWKGILFFLGVCLLSNILLEVINYVEHYGLQRSPKDDGFEPVTLNHAWNSNFWLSNALLLHLQRHSDHHLNAGRPYPYLRHYSDSPQLPYSYSAMLLFALLPPLWRRTMDPLTIKINENTVSGEKILASVRMHNS